MEEYSSTRQIFFFSSYRVRFSASLTNIKGFLQLFAMTRETNSLSAVPAAGIYFFLWSRWVFAYLQLEIGRLRMNQHLHFHSNVCSLLRRNIRKFARVGGRWNGERHQDWVVKRRWNWKPHWPCFIQTLIWLWSKHFSVLPAYGYPFS